MKSAMMAILFVASTATAHTPPSDYSQKPVLADLKDLKALGIPVLAQSEKVGVGYAMITPAMESQIQERAHQVGKCGGFEDLSQETALHFNSEAATDSFLNPLVRLQELNELYEHAPFRMMAVEKNVQIEQALLDVKEDNLRSYVQWLSSFPTRNGRDANANRHVTEMKVRLEAMLENSPLPYEIKEINHTSTNQKSLQVRLIGKDRPNEIVVLGGHLDSINQSRGGAPGADDNASGSANLIEALRILMTQAQPQRSIDFFWYAGEENGLLGSAEIAKQYKAEKKDVVAVLQLDMTLFPGSGELVIGSMTDFTSAWLRDYFKSINGVYLNARIVDDKCGYGCSDHASWHRQGYPTLMPFESTFRGSNKNIHTSRDVISPELNFKHSAVYTKIAIVMGMDLANSQLRQPF